MRESCFVVMAIGDQTHGDAKVSARDLRDTYDNVIREALIQARPNLEVTRADDVSAPGTITTDILTRLMHSTFAIVDITFPNPNVFYEAGIRHACRPGTFLIRDADAAARAPFDVSHQRYYEYRKTPAGIKALANDFRGAFAWYDSHTGEPDNQLLSLAKLTHYNFPQYGQDRREEVMDNISELFTLFIGMPELLALVHDAAMPNDEKQQRLLQALAANPRQSKKFMKLILKSGMLGA